MARPIRSVDKITSVNKCSGNTEEQILQTVGLCLILLYFCVMYVMLNLVNAVILYDVLVLCLF